jgi:hypothetical protein
MRTTSPERSGRARACPLAGRRLQMLFAGRTRRRQARAALDELHGLIVDSGIDRADPRWRRALDLRPDVGDIDGSIWDDFRERAVAYNGLLVAIANLEGDPEAVHGHIPGEIAERIDTHELDTSLLDVSLRGYQAFGARFALAQGRAILGDEMGLGKTMQSIAVAAHLDPSGAGAGERDVLLLGQRAVEIREVRARLHLVLRAGP